MHLLDNRWLDGMYPRPLQIGLCLGTGREHNPFLGHSELLLPRVKDQQPASCGMLLAGQYGFFILREGCQLLHRITIFVFRSTQVLPRRVWALIFIVRLDHLHFRTELPTVLPRWVHFPGLRIAQVRGSRSSALRTLEYPRVVRLCSLLRRTH